MSKKQPTIVITGANGFLGTQLVNHFAKKGWEVRALVRNPKTAKPQPHVTFMAYDMTKAIDDAIFAGADYLVHAAYIKEDRQHPNAFELNMEGTKQLLTASRAHKLKKNIFLSSMSAQSDAVSTYGKQKYAIQALFNRNADVVIRSGLMIGNAGLIREISQFIKTKHMAPLIDGGNQPLQTIAVYDMVRVIDRIIGRDVTGIFTIAEPAPITYRGLYKAIAKKMRTPLVLIPVPFWIPLMVIRTIQMLHLPFKITEDNLQGLRKLRVEDTTNDLATLQITLDPIEIVLDKPNIL